MNEENLNIYYNKFTEKKRLKSRHGIVEYTISNQYIHNYLDLFENPKILDIGAGMGAYSIPLHEEGYEVCSVDLVKHNLAEIKKHEGIKTIHANATDLKKIEDNSYDVTLLFGPMYHLIDDKDKIKALKEAIRVTKKDGYILVAYIMNNYAVLTRGFKEKEILNEIKNNKLNKDFKVTPSDDDLYSFVDVERINKINNSLNITREKIITPDGPANYMREIVNKLTEEEFEKYIEFIKSICEDKYILNASAHVIDILKK